ncbi:hypothetical protein [Benzoatithermus flavus]|uniref:Uncharacterized protein n=1 Tax=Benzoatithermus flavus TaxID=3108223 RepID=A0ABU8XS23_9PROT
MQPRHASSACLALLALLASPAAFAASGKPPKPVPPRDLRLECRIRADGGATTGKVRYEDRKGRRQLWATLEGPIGGDLAAGHVFDVVLAGVKAGQITLAIGASGKLEGALRLDSKPVAGGTKAFPPGFPILDAGAAAQIGSYGCTLQKGR